MNTPRTRHILNIADITLLSMTPEQMPPAPLAASYDLCRGEIASRIGTRRLGTERHCLRGGDIIACPPGDPETAHQIINTGDVELLFPALSTRGMPDICEYPDSGKYQIIEQSQGKMQPGPCIIGRYGSMVDYQDGEQRLHAAPRIGRCPVHLIT